MANVYVSNTTSNGYTTGNDANNAGQMASKSTPALTITGAYTRASAGDTIIINGGTYAEVALVNAQKLNLTFTPDGVVTWQNSAGTICIFNFQATGSGCVINPGFIFDGQNVMANLITTNTNVLVPLATIHGCQFINYTSSALKLGEVGLFTMDQNWSITTPPSLSGQAPILIAPSATGTNAAQSVYALSNGSIAMGTLTAAVGHGIRVNSAGGPPTVTLTNVTVTGTVTGSQNQHGISCDSHPAVMTVTNCTVTWIGTGNTNTLIGVDLSGGGTHLVKGSTVNVTISGDACSVSGFYSSSATGDRPKFSGCVANLTTTGTGVTNGLSGFNMASGAGADFLNNTVTIVLAAENTTVNGIFGQPKFRTVAYGNTINISSAIRGLVMNGIIFKNAAVYSGAYIYVQSNAVNMPPGAADTAAGIGIQVGDNNSPASRNSFGYTLISGNAVNGCNHGILAGNINNHTCIGNTTKNTKLALVDKNTNVGTNLPGIWVRNVSQLLAGTSSGFATKGSQGAVFDGNWMYLDLNGAGVHFLDCYLDDVDVRAAAGCAFRNNVLVMQNGAIPLNPVNVDATSTATFSNNTYYCPSGFGNVGTGNWQGFVYQGVTYASVAAWAAAHETNAKATNPTVRSLVSRT